MRTVSASAIFLGEVLNKKYKLDPKAAKMAPTNKMMITL